MITPEEIETLEGFQNLDDDFDWADHDPSFEWTVEDLEEFEHEERAVRAEIEALIGWWEMEGVRCATFGRNPNENPYKLLLDQ